MPICTLHTNVPSSEISRNFEIELTDLLAEILGKPIEKISVLIRPGERMVRGNSSAPTCLLDIWSIAVFSPEKNPGYAEMLFPFLSKQLGIENDRVAVLFHDITTDQVARPSV